MPVEVGPEQKMTKSSVEVGPTKKMTKSSSISTFNNSSKENTIDQDDILSLTQNVKLFSDGLNQLKIVFSESTGNGRVIECEKELFYPFGKVLSDHLLSIKLKCNILHLQGSCFFRVI